ncbi:MAG: hypothetical protein ACKO4Q_17585, partial [Planctomycetota bacterium]
MKRVPVLAGILAALLAACATQGGSVSAAALAQLGRAEEREREGDLAGARTELEIAKVQAGGVARLGERGTRLEFALAAAELEPFRALFDELSAALERRDHELAARLVLRADALQPRGAAALKLTAFRNILDGRRTAEALGLRLAAEPTGNEGEYRVTLHARNELPESVRLRCPGSALKFLSLGVSEVGIESRARRRVLTDALADLELKSGADVVVELGTFYVPSRGLVAARGRWMLSTLGGTLELGERELPANSFDAQSCEVVRLDPCLPSSAVEPAEFARYVERGAPSLPALLERTGRLAPERRDEALDLATPALLRCIPEELERIAPALRWLSGLDEPPVDARGWKAWLEARGARASDPARPRLDLPSDGRQS